MSQQIEQTHQTQQTLARAAVTQPPVRAHAAAYLMLRGSGVLLAVLVLGHLVVTHITTDVADTGAGFITRRWAGALWPAWDGLMLIAGVAHAGCGLWVVIADHTTPSATRRAWHTALATGCVALAGLGVAVIVVAAG